METEYQLRQDILQIGKLLWDKGFVAANDGNISVRLGERGFLVTASGVNKGRMSQEHILYVDSAYKARGNLPISSESPMHFAIYRKRSDSNAVVHAHPPYATAFAVAGIPLDQCILAEIIVTLGKIPLVPYQTPSSGKLAEKVADEFTKFNGVLLQNHGVVTVGKNLWEAYDRLERIEQFAKILYLAKNLGNPNILRQEQVEELINTFGRPIDETGEDICRLK